VPPSLDLRPRPTNASRMSIFNRPPDPKAILLALAAAGVVAAAIDALLIEPAWVQVSRFDVPIADLPPDWDGATVAHLTDLHYGDPRSRQLFEWMVRTVNAEEPDLIVITGDYVVDRASEAIAAASYLARLKAKRAILGVLGDHDYEYKSRSKQEIKGLVDHVTSAGVRLLRNDAVELPGGLLVAGVDPTTRKLHRSDVPAAFRALRGRLPHLFLTHSPDLIHEIAAENVPLVLCGHTHGGQVVVPFYGPPITHSSVAREFCSGWSRLNETRMFTSRGLGSHFSLRFFCRPQIAILTLRSG
jgi:predicted MPP superfamily phosphohydrolase